MSALFHNASSGGANDGTRHPLAGFRQQSEKDGKNADRSREIRFMGRKKGASEPALAKITCRSVNHEILLSEYLGKNSFPIAISRQKESNVKSCIICPSSFSAVDRKHCVLDFENENLMIYNRSASQDIRVKLSSDRELTIDGGDGSVGYPVKQRCITFGIGWLSFDLELLPPIAPYLSSNDVTLLIENTRAPHKPPITAVAKNNTTIGRAKADILLDDPSISRYFAYVKMNEDSCQMLSVVDTDIFTMTDGTKCGAVELTDDLVFTCASCRFTVLKVFKGFGFEQDIPSASRGQSRGEKRSGGKESPVYLLPKEPMKGTPIMRFTFSGPLRQDIAPIEVTDDHLRVNFTSADDAVEGCQVVLTDRTLGVVRTHCYLAIREGRLYLIDGGSMAGTKVSIGRKAQSLEDAPGKQSVEIAERYFSFSMGFLTVHCELLPGIAPHLKDRYVKLRITNLRQRDEEPRVVTVRDGNTIGRASDDVTLHDETTHRFLGWFSLSAGSAQLLAVDGMNYFTLPGGRSVNSVELIPKTVFKSGPYYFEVLEFFDGISFD